MSTGRGLEVRTTCDPRYVSKDDLLKIAQIASNDGVKHFAVQKYTPYHEEEAAQTTPTMREQFFNDDDLKKKIESLFESVIWRNA